MSKYNLPVEYGKLQWAEKRFVREQYTAEQHGACYECGAPLSGDPALYVEQKPVRKELYPTGFFRNPVHLHHDHGSGLTLGSVHAKCNAYLWDYKGE